MKNPDIANFHLAIAGVVHEALRVPPAKITGPARIFEDLGAESIDLLDIRFRLEQIFGIAIGEDEIAQSLGPALSAAAIRERLTVGSLEQFVRGKLGVAMPP